MAIVWTMPRRSILSSAARDSLFVLPDTQDEIIRYYTLTESDLAITNQHRGGANRQRDRAGNGSDPEPSQSGNPSAVHQRYRTELRYRASGLTLVTAAIVLWNTIYLETGDPSDQGSWPARR